MKSPFHFPFHICFFQETKEINSVNLARLGELRGGGKDLREKTQGWWSVLGKWRLKMEDRNGATSLRFVAGAIQKRQQINPRRQERPSTSQNRTNELNQHTIWVTTLLLMEERKKVWRKLRKSNKRPKKLKVLKRGTENLFREKQKRHLGLSLPWIFRL